jgi:DHA2 family multidrug resistance protein
VPHRGLITILIMLATIMQVLDTTIANVVVQGLGLGLVFVPLSTVAFATLDPGQRTDAASLFSLVRNLGSSIGISVVTVVLTRNIQVNRAELGAATLCALPLVFLLRKPVAAQAAGGAPAAHMD